MKRRGQGGWELRVGERIGKLMFWKSDAEVEKNGSGRMGQERGSANLKGRPDGAERFRLPMNEMRKEICL